MTSVTLPRKARIPVFVVLLIVAFSVVYPVVYLALAAFRSNAAYLRDPLGLPSSLMMQNFDVLWNGYGVGRALVNSFIVVGSGLILQVVVALLAAFALAKMAVPGGRVISASFVSVMLIPSQVLIIPVYLLLSRVHLVGNLVGLILVYVATGLPFAVFFLTITIRSIDQAVLEAARIDGAGFHRTLTSVVVPMAGGGIATLAVLQFLTMWNELLFAYILLPNTALTLVTPAVSQIGTNLVGNQPLVSAGLIVTALPPLILLSFTSRYLVAGLSAGIGK
ncbi:carbohydrate ABC transporter permease [Amnibacterium sp. CER49]|uniref:carbohydrate ABC transporter permease n=1 Tax=Amnibacterium sp. CER49 TaxID=3039161 RepID=UPI00244D6928|nr:carbohydrate ABC transporter permease [Amnibacterium sp. CER49]MDH2444100.1 carbohydrate ABC transporter permease [Amnibacterium sp. CER49]